MGLSERIEAQRVKRVQVAERARARALRAWSRFDVDDLDGSWDAVGPSLVAGVVSAQRAAVATAEPFLVRSGATLDAHVAVESFTGVTRDGLELAPELFGAVTGTKTLIGRGAPARDAFTRGAAYLAVVVTNAVQDMARQADLVAGAAAKRRRWVRVIRPGACSRCAILAGSRSMMEPFERHPSCQCQAFPVEDDRVPDGVFGSPLEYFNSLSRAEQERVFTKAGAEAIRAGADPIKVVNARRGALSRSSGASVSRLVPRQVGVKPDGSPLLVYVTPEGTTRRGVYGRRSREVRLMPEQIMRMSDDPERRVELLRRYGYLY